MENLDVKPGDSIRLTPGALASRANHFFTFPELSPRLLQC
jgi:hypothetical protein